MDRHPVRWVKVAWLGSLLECRSKGVRAAARDALRAVDEEDADALQRALAQIAEYGDEKLGDEKLAADAFGARAAVERAVEEARAARAAAA